MAVKTVKYLLKILLSISKRTKKAGFTLIELLITILISTIIITALLDFVVDLLQTDRREYARSETQREMEMALNFITDDLREAVYIYDRVEQARGSLNALKGYIPPTNNGSTAIPSNSIPVLAFWKAERLPYSTTQSLPNDLNSCGTSVTGAECRQVVIRRRAYSLVVYYVVKNPDNDLKWKGQARIIRYVFRKYQNLPNLAKTNGYIDPAEQSTFENWPYKDGNPNGTASGGGTGTMTAVLVDFVDNPANNVQTEPCPGNNSDPNLPDYRRVPQATSDSERSTSFYVCVKRLGVVEGTNEQEKLNQDVYIYLRGNPIGKVNAKDVQPLATIRAGAIARGVIDKKP